MREQAYELKNEVLLASESEDKELRMLFDLTQNLIREIMLAFRNWKDNY